MYNSLNVINDYMVNFVEIIFVFNMNDQAVCITYEHTNHIIK